MGARLHGCRPFCPATPRMGIWLESTSAAHGGGSLPGACRGRRFAGPAAAAKSCLDKLGRVTIYTRPDKEGLGAEVRKPHRQPQKAETGVIRITFERKRGGRPEILDAASEILLDPATVAPSRAVAATIRYSCPSCGALAHTAGDALVHRCSVENPQRIDPQEYVGNAGKKSEFVYGAAAMIGHHIPSVSFIEPRFGHGYMHPCASNDAADSSACRIFHDPPVVSGPPHVVATTDTPSQVAVRFECQGCGEAFLSDAEAHTHCSSCPSAGEAMAHCPPDGVMEGPPMYTVVTPAHVAAASCQAEAAHTLGPPVNNAAMRCQPELIRLVDPETGVAQTVVLNEDGSQRYFGERTVASMVASTEGQFSGWISSLTHPEVRGLLHEMSQHIQQGVRRYYKTKSEVDQLTVQASYAYFGLSMGACEKQLDNAYRKLAKQMHPDKNGGTEEAKRRFQHMQERYEALKSGTQFSRQEKEDEQIHAWRGAEGDSTVGVGEDDDALHPDDVSSSSSSFSYCEAAMKMLKNLKNINSNLAILAERRSQLSV